MKTQEQLFLQDVWRKAWGKADGLTIRFPSKAGAVRARMQLYNAVAAQKKGTDMDDMNLVHAAEGLEIVWVDECTIRLQKRAESDMMKGLVEAMGKTPDEYFDPQMKESADRLLKELGAMGGPKPSDATANAPAPGEHQSNPFYGKRD